MKRTLGPWEAYGSTVISKHPNALAACQHQCYQHPSYPHPDLCFDERRDYHGRLIAESVNVSDRDLIVVLESLAAPALAVAALAEREAIIGLIPEALETLRTFCERANKLREIEERIDVRHVMEAQG